MSDSDPVAKSPHAFMREAMGVQTRLLAQRRAFVTAALMSERAALNEGRGFVASEVNAYFDGRMRELPVPPPRLRTWRT